MLDRSNPTGSNTPDQNEQLNKVKGAEYLAKKEGGPGPEDSSGIRAVAGAVSMFVMGPIVGLATDAILGAMAGGAKGGTTNLGRSQPPPQGPTAVNLLGKKTSQFSKFLGRSVKKPVQSPKSAFARAANWRRIQDEKKVADNAVTNPFGSGGQDATNRLQRGLAEGTAPAKTALAKLKPRRAAALAGPR